MLTSRPHPRLESQWLHYLVLKLLHAKRLRPPAAPRKPSTRTSSAFTERECYACLVEVEELLGRCVAACRLTPNRKSRRKTQAVRKPAAARAADTSGPKCAGDVLRLAVDRGWVRDS